MSATGNNGFDAQKDTINTTQNTQNDRSSAFINFVNAANNTNTATNNNNVNKSNDYNNDEIQCVGGIQQNKSTFSFNSPNDFCGTNNNMNKDDYDDDNNNHNFAPCGKDQVVTRGLA